MYDDLAEVYDRFIDWPARLARELPLLNELLGGARRVADLACGTGRHAAALAAAGRQVTGFDPSGPALSLARAAAGGTDCRFVQAAFGQLSDAGGGGGFEAAICLGNSLAHILTDAELTAAIDDVEALLAPGGRLVVHLLNLPRLRERGERWLPLRASTDPDGGEWLFQRLYDFLPSRRVAFQFLVCHRPAGGEWSRRIETTTLRDWGLDELRPAFCRWAEVLFAGGLDGQPFEPETSTDLVVLARRK